MTAATVSILSKTRPNLSLSKSYPSTAKVVGRTRTRTTTSAVPASNLTARTETWVGLDSSPKDQIRMKMAPKTKTWCSLAQKGREIAININRRISQVRLAFPWPQTSLTRSTESSSFRIFLALGTTPKTSFCRQRLIIATYRHKIWHNWRKFKIR